MNPETTAVPYERLGILIDGRWIYEAERRDRKSVV